MPGAERLGDCAALQQLLRQQQDAQRWVTAICASPEVVLERAGLIAGRRATAHPAFSDKLANGRWAHDLGGLRVLTAEWHPTVPDRIAWLHPKYRL